MRARLSTYLFASVVCGALASAIVHGQIGKIVQQEWVTSRADAQRSGWIGTDAAISVDSMQRPGFTLQWKTSFDSQPRQLTSLHPGVVIGNLGFGTKPISFVTGSANRLFAIDNDTGVLFWERTFGDRVGPEGTLECPGGITGAATRMATVTPTIPPAPRPPRERPAYSSGVGAPGEGVPALLMGRSGRTGSPDSGLPPLSNVRRPGASQPRANPPAARGTGAVSPTLPPVGQIVYALSSEGSVHILGMYTGKDLVRPVAFLPADANASDLIALNDTIYATTIHGCGGVADGVWALDLSRETRGVRSWTTSGGSPTGAPAFGTDGTLFVAVGPKTGATPGGYANAVVALDPTTLVVKDWFTRSDTEFVTPPVVFPLGDRNLVAAGTNDGSLVVLDGASLGGPTHEAAIGRVKVTSSDHTGIEPLHLTTWVDQSTTRWIAMPTATTIEAFTVSFMDGAVALKAGWSSQLPQAPVAPVVVNGVAFIVSSGESRFQAGAAVSAASVASQSVPAVLHALDAATGRELWNSANTITSFAHGDAVWPGLGQIHVATYDGTVYAFGFPVERN